MLSNDPPWWTDYLVTSGLALPGERSAFYRDAARGYWVRVRSGVYVRAKVWNALHAEDRHLARARATALVDPAAVFSHLTAALLWGLPLVDPPPSLPHVTTSRASGGRSSQSVVRFAVGDPDECVRLDGLRVTGLRETLLAVASTWDAAVSIPILDAALAGRAVRAAAVTREELADRRPGRAERRVDFAVAFADPRSGSPGESLSRLTILRAGLPAPELQRRFDDDRGLIGFVDFWWPEFGVIGEFDGLGKYRRDLSGRGRSADEIVIAEKHREDRLRALGHRVIRWGWSTARSVPATRDLLTRAGIRAEKVHPRP